MRDATQLVVRLNQIEKSKIEKLTTDNQVSASELVRKWLEAAYDRHMKGATCPTG